MRVTRSVCNFCYVLCPTVVHVDGDRASKLEPDHDHPYGGLMCVKGKAAAELVENPDRVLYPLKRVGPKSDPPRWERVSWDEALRDIAQRLQRIRSEDGPEAISFSRGTRGGTGLVDSERWLFRLANTIGTPNIVSTTHICQWVRDDGTRYTFGGPTPPPDVDHAASFLLWGHNPSATSVRLAADLKAAQSRGMKLVTVDPRRVGLATSADVHLPVNPGTDGALALALAHVLVERGWDDRDFVRRWTNAPLLVRHDSGRLLRWSDIEPGRGTNDYVAWAGRAVRYDTETGRYEEPEERLDLDAAPTVSLASGERCSTSTVFRSFRELIAEFSPKRAAEITGVSEVDIVAAAEILSSHRPVAHYFWNGIAQNTNSGQTARAISVLYALLGDWDAPGGNVVVPRPRLRAVDLGQLLPPEKLKRRLGWEERPLGPPRTRRDSTAYDLYRSVLEGEPYRVRALLAFGNNMLMANGDSLQGREALRRLDLMVCVDYFVTPTAALADYVLPAATFLESPALVAQWDLPAMARTHVQYRPAALAPRGEARSDTQILFDLAVHLGYGDKFWNGDVESGFRHELEACGLTLEQLREHPEGLPTREPPILGEKSYGRPGVGFDTPTRKIEIYAVPFAEHGEDPLPRYTPPVWSVGSAPRDIESFPFVLTNAKVVQFCHAQHRSLPSLRRARPHPEVELHADTAKEAGVTNGQWVAVETPEGAMRARVKVTAAVKPGVVVAQHGWWQACDALGLPGYAPFSAEGANVNLLVSNKWRDSVSGATPHRTARCRLRPVEA